MTNSIDVRALSRNIRQLYELKCDNPGAFQHEITVLKGRLQSHECRRIHGAAVRARCQRILNTEQPTHRQAWEDERSHAISIDIVEICMGDKVLNYSDDIMMAFSNHYTSLFKHSTSQLNSALELESLLPCMIDSLCEMLSCLITVADVDEAINAPLSSKIPGLTVYTPKFTSPFPLALLHDSCSTKAVSRSFCVSNTVLIPTSTDCDKHRNIDGYHPIALSNVHY